MRIQGYEKDEQENITKVLHNRLSQERPRVVHQLLLLLETKKVKNIPLVLLEILANSNPHYNSLFFNRLNLRCVYLFQFMAWMTKTFTYTDFKHYLQQTQLYPSIVINALKLQNLYQGAWGEDDVLFCVKSQACEQNLFIPNL